jgi:hypothetical protein
MSIHPIETFSPSGAYTGYIELHVFEGDDGVQVAANGDGWAIRSVPGKLYRFHV